MIVNKEKCRFSVTDILLIVVSAVFFIGIRSFFAVCPVGGEMIMSCHWAGETLKALSIVLLVLSVIHLFVPDKKIKLGMDIPMCAISLLAVFVPGTVINLCQNADMACRSAAQLWTVILCIILTLAALADIILYASSLSKDKHSRKD